jgi:hypothetical protein
LGRHLVTGGGGFILPALVHALVYAGSSSAYGNTPGQPRVKMMPTTPVSPYAVSKLAGELRPSLAMVPIAYLLAAASISW